MVKERLTDKIKDYVRREGSCTPGEPELVLERDDMLVYKVPVIEFHDWEVEPPEFWYVVPDIAMNLYASDTFKRQRTDVADCILSFHVGLMARMMRKGKFEQCAGCGEPLDRGADTDGKADGKADAPTRP